MFVTYNVETREVETVLYDHRLITDDMRTRGFFVDSLPEIDNTLFGKYGVYIADPISKTVSVEYRDRPLTPEEEVQQLKNRIELMQQALDDLLLGGM